MHIPPTRKTLLMQRDARLTALWGGAGRGGILASWRPRPWYYFVNLVANGVPGGLCVFVHFCALYRYGVGWGGVGYWRPDDHVLDITLSTRVPPTRKTLMMQRDARLTARWGGGEVGWGGILTSWRRRPWYYVVNACCTNYEDVDDATWC